MDIKFAHYLSTLERDAPTEWHDKFIKYVNAVNVGILLSFPIHPYSSYYRRYKKLKKMLKSCTNDTNDKIDEEAESAFFGELQEELKFVNQTFHEEAYRMVGKYQRSTRGLLSWFWGRWTKRKHASGLAEQAYWCRKYARANAVALRKILKKHDKTCSNRKGREFLQKCWRSTSSKGIGLFLHSPLLDELKAIQEKLQILINDTDYVDPNEDRQEVFPLHPLPRENGPSSSKTSPVQAEHGTLPINQMGSTKVSNRASVSNTPVETLDVEEPDVRIPDDSGESNAIPAKSETSPSLKQQRYFALAAIEESSNMSVGFLGY